jgi:arylsulfatase A-like enzyme
MEAQRSLVLITVDCFRADHAGFLGYDRPTTPFLDSLAGNSLVFSNAIVAGAPTYFSFPAIMSSRYPLSLGRDVVGLADEPTIASALNAAGYTTGAFLAANPYLSARFGYDTGFQTFRDFLDAGAGSDVGNSDGGNGLGLRSRGNLRLAKVAHSVGPVGRLYDDLYFQYCQRVAATPAPSFDQLRRFPAADVIVDHARDWLHGVRDRPFFLWLHLMDPHSPYYPRQEALTLMGNSLDASRARYLNSYWNRSDLDHGDRGKRRLERYREDVVALYDAGIRWMDAQMARLVDTLKGFGLWQNCVFALTADHGEEFLDHGGRYHSPTKVSEELVRVPLLLHGIEQRKPEVINQPVSLLNLAPTLLDALKVSIPHSFRGRSYSPNDGTENISQADAIIECVSGCNNPFIMENRLHPRLLAVREARFKMVLDFNSSVEQLYDLDADPRELHTLPMEAEKVERRRLLDRARSHLADSSRSRDTEERLAACLRGLRLEWASPGNRASA